MKRREHKFLTHVTGASFSDCERFRYTLWRTWAAGPLLNFIGQRSAASVDVEFLFQSPISHSAVNAEGRVNAEGTLPAFRVLVP